MPYEKKPGDAAAWNPSKENQPLSIRCSAHRALAEGEEFEVAIWRVVEKSKENAPDWSGHVQDKWEPPQRQGHMSRADYKRQGGPANAGEVASKGFDDDIPF